MADSKNDVAQQRRAGWVGLRTLRQRPKVVDHTAAGDPVYEVRSVRLLLRPDASHFNRLVQCAKCGRDVPGPPVLDAASLEHPVNAVICKSCVQASAIATARQPDSIVANAGPAPQAVPRPEVTRSVPAVADGGGDGRLSTLETQLRAVVRQVRELAEGDRSGSVDDGQAEERVQAQVHEAVRAELAGLRAELAAVRDAEAPQVAALADQIRRDFGAMAEALQGQRRDLSTLVAMVDEARTEVARLGRSNAELAASQAALDQHVAELSEQVAAAPVTEERVPADLSPLVRAVEELSQARGQIDDRVDVLVREAAEQRARMEALLAAVDGGARHLQEVEQRMRDDVDRLTGLLEGQRRGLQSVLSSASDSTMASVGDPDGDDLLDVLERQLLEAERRLAHRSIGAAAD
jgi:septal ring factor EnvC (AmiA/AmiB activator)